jgi:hypothetical protein
LFLTDPLLHFCQHTLSAPYFAGLRSNCWGIFLVLRGIKREKDSREQTGILKSRQQSKIMAMVAASDPGKKFNKGSKMPRVSDWVKFSR